LDPIGNSSQKVGNNFDFDTKSEKQSVDDYIKIESNQNRNSVSIQNDKDAQFLSIINYQEDKFQTMLRDYRTKKKKELTKLIRMIVDCMLVKRKMIKIILCNEIDYLMFEFYAEVLIKLVVYHKNENVKIESCQFRNGKCYYKKLPRMNLMKAIGV
jgi:hypothetical protein